MINYLSRYSLVLLICVSCTLPVTAGDWPGWRGPTGDGVYPEKQLPTKWSPDDNVRWRVKLPGPGNSSPIVWGNRIFLTQAVDADNRRTVICFDRTNGNQLWQSGVTYSDREPTQRSNPYCAATPVTDGERVIASFGSAGLYCYDFEGKELWHREFGKMNHMFGNASSPIIHGNLCIFNFGPDQKARLIAVNKTNGKTVWEVQPPKVDPSEQQQRSSGGRGGRGGFGPGTILAPRMLSQSDTDKNEKVSRQEFTALADTWYDKLDSEKTGKLSQDDLIERFSLILPPREGFGSRGGRGGGGQNQRGGRNRGPGRFLGPGLFEATDTDKNGSLTREELKRTFTAWYAKWDTEKTSALGTDELQAGLNAVLPRPNFGGRGGGRGGRGFGGGGAGGSWSTPIIVTAGGRAELIMNFPNRLAAYDPATGDQLWLSKGLGGTIYTTPVWGEGTLFAASSGRGGGNAIAVKPGGKGDVTESSRLWRQDRFKSAIGSGVIHEGHLYMISQDGIAGCYELATGKMIWEERLRGSSSRGSSWSSMLLAGDKIYVPNQAGDVFVLQAAPKFEVLATNSVKEPTNASLAASNGDLFLRTDDSLWCLSSNAR